MVLSTTGEAHGAAPTLSSDDGSQALELALAVPGVVLLLVLVLHAGLFGMDLVAAQGIAREAARVAAVTDDAAVRAAATAAAGRRAIGVRIDPPHGSRRPGDLVSVEVDLATGAFTPFGVATTVPARAVMRVEDS